MRIATKGKALTAKKKEKRLSFKEQPKSETERNQLRNVRKNKRRILPVA